jgi:hypothetical protein
MEKIVDATQIQVIFNSWNEEVDGTMIVLEKLFP